MSLRSDLQHPDRQADPLAIDVDKEGIWPETVIITIIEVLNITVVVVITFNASIVSVLVTWPEIVSTGL